MRFCFTHASFFQPCAARSGYAPRCSVWIVTEAVCEWGITPHSFHLRLLEMKSYLAVCVCVCVCVWLRYAPWRAVIGDSVCCGHCNLYSCCTVTRECTTQGLPCCKQREPKSCSNLLLQVFQSIRSAGFQHTASADPCQMDFTRTQIFVPAVLFITLELCFCTAIYARRFRASLYLSLERELRAVTNIQFAALNY